jgi:predicted small secreted protein
MPRVGRRRNVDAEFLVPALGRRLMPRISLLVLIFAAGLALSSCHTMEGFGQDLSILGNKITGKADQHSKN